MPLSNASIAVRFPNGSVIMSVFVSGTSPSSAGSMLCEYYNTLEKATSIVILGDFEKVAPEISDCNHSVLDGEDIGDCIAESFQTYEEYEKTIAAATYGKNYIYRDSWNTLEVNKNKVVYKRLKKTNKRKKKTNDGSNQ